MSTPKKQSSEWVSVSTFGSIWKPEKPGDEKIFELGTFRWVKKSRKEMADTEDKSLTHFPAVDAVEIATGEEFSLRTDFAWLRELETFPPKSIVKVTFVERKKIGKRNALVYDIAYKGNVKRVQRFSERVSMPIVKKTKKGK